jgi:uncharacterized protein (TIGR02391 family)
MPLGETAQKYAQAVFEKKMQDLSREYEREALMFKGSMNESALQRHLLELAIGMPARQARAKADALLAAYERDSGVLDAGGMEEITQEIEQLARNASQEFIASRQHEADAKAQRNGTVDLDLSPKLRELERKTQERIRNTLAEVRLSLEAKVYEGQLDSRSGKKRKSATAQYASEWHAEIEKVSRQLFEDGHYREAVLNSYIRVIDAVKQKSVIPEDGDGLMGHAFGCDVSRLPKVQFNPCQTQADMDEQKGIMFLFKGIVGMRNLKAHTIKLFDDEQRAREYLGLSSLLMRLLDDASVNP